jgi:hypothetical protein
MFTKESTGKDGGSIGFRHGGFLVRGCKHGIFAWSDSSRRQFVARSSRRWELIERAFRSSVRTDSGLHPH